MIYHTKKNNFKKTPKQKEIKLIIFLLKLLIEAETNY